MNHLKTYEGWINLRHDISSDLAKDLEDSLFEVFDKFQIKRGDPNKYFSWNTHKSVDGHFIRIGQISHTQRPPQILDDRGNPIYGLKAEIYQEILKLKPRIERGIKNEIEIISRSNAANNWIDIFIVDEYLKFNEEWIDDFLKEKLIDLSDCLMEVFDKYNIVERKPSFNRSEDIDRDAYWYVSNAVYINNISYGEKDKIFEEIERIKPMIEKRVGFKIFICDGIYEDGSFYIIVASLEYGALAPDDLNENRSWYDLDKDEKKKIERELIEDLSDNLQEIFDKYLIHEVPDVRGIESLNLPIPFGRLTGFDSITIIGIHDNQSHMKILHDIRDILPSIGKKLGCIIEADPITSSYVGYAIKIHLHPSTCSLYKDDPHWKYTTVGKILESDLVNYIVEDLADCLQEVFDKFRISQVPKEGFVDIRLVSEFSWIETSNYVMVLNIPNSREALKIIESINKIIPNIQKRIGREVYIQDGFSSDYGQYLQIIPQPRSKQLLWQQQDIKTFESYDEEGFTMKVDSDKFEEKEDKFAPENFTENEIKKIESSSKNYKIAKAKRNKIFGKVFPQKDHILILEVQPQSDKSLLNNEWNKRQSFNSRLYKTMISINKRSDEWFLIKKYPEPRGDSRYMKVPTHLTEYYIIDGFSDLLEVLSGDRIIGSSI